MVEDGWPERLGEVYEAAQLRDVDEAADMFETLDQRELEKSSFLGGPQAPINRSASM